MPFDLTRPAGVFLNNSIQIRGSQFRKGVTAPTDVTIGTTPTIGAVLFDATAELASAYMQMPDDWDRNVDCSLTLICSLVNGQTNNDSLDWTLDYTVPITLSTGNGVSKTSTNLTTSVAVTTANGLAVDDMYHAVFTLASADATNPFSDSNSQGFALEIHLTNVTQVAAIHLQAAVINYRGISR